MSRAQLLLRLLLLVGCVGCHGSADGRLADAVTSELATVTYARVDAPPAVLLAQGSLWDGDSQPTPRPRAERGAIGPDGSLVLRENAAFVAQFPARTIGKLKVSLRGTLRGAPARVRLFSLVAPINALERVDAIPDDLERRLHATLADFTWAPGGAAAVAASPKIDGDAATSWLLVSVETVDGGELRLDRVVVEETLDAQERRFNVGGETRPGTPIGAGSVRAFELPALAAGATVELAVAPPEEMAPLRAPMTLRCELPGSREQVLQATFAAEAAEPTEPAGLAALPVRRWRDLVFHIDRAIDHANGRAATLTIAGDGSSGVAALASSPRVLHRREPATPLNLLLISLDTLRADRVGAWGAKSGATPNLDRFAARCVRFAHACSPANFTTPAHASMMTGLQPAVHGAYRYGQRSSIRPWPNVAGACAKSGMATAAFTGGGFLDPLFGFDEGFDRYRVLDLLMTPANPRYATGPRKQMEEWNRRLREGVSLADVNGWLAAHADRRFFLFFHTYHVHDYSPSPAAAARNGVDPAASWPRPADLDPRLFPAITADSAQLAHYSRTYDATLSEADAAFGELVATLERTGLLDHTAVVVTADHGEGFQEHGFLFHATGLNDEVLHVPLLLWVPGVHPAVVDAPVSLIDVAPTLLDLAGVEPLPRTQGRSLVPLLRGAEPAERLLLAQDCPPDGLIHSALVSGRFKYLRLMKAAPAGELKGASVVAAERLFDLQADPREQHDLAGDATHALELAQARAALDRTLVETAAAAGSAFARDARGLVLDPDLAEQIRQLGYGGY